jgi:hypothetical protein
VTGSSSAGNPYTARVGQDQDRAVAEVATGIRNILASAFRASSGDSVQATTRWSAVDRFWRLPRDCDLGEGSWRGSPGILTGDHLSAAW